MSLYIRCTGRYLPRVMRVNLVLALLAGVQSNGARETQQESEPPTNDVIICDTNAAAYTMMGLSELELACSRNDAAAQIEMAYRYGHGRGVPKDQSKAGYWADLAAQNGSVDAQYLKGILLDMNYTMGIGSEADITNAVMWITKAAATGCAKAQFSLGGLYESGNVERDLQKAKFWYQKAADQGLTEAQDALKRVSNPNYQLLSSARAYYVNYIVDNDNRAALDNAIIWFTKAADAGDAEAQCQLGEFCESTELGPDLQKAREWYGKAAAQGNADAQKSLARLDESSRQPNAAYEESTPELRILKQAKTLAQAMVDGRYDVIASMSPPSMSKSLGTPEQIEANVRQGLGKGSRITACEAGPILSQASLDADKFATVTTKTTMDVDGEVSTISSYLLAISDDGGSKWYFMNGSDRLREFVRNFSPAVESELIFPESFMTMGDMRFIKKGNDWVPDSTTMDYMKRALEKPSKSQTGQ
ncbi:MAG: Secretory immunoglobulin A-binding protein EsiB [Nitrosomonadaceae bacterium]|nr:Secretory immunoglobulin A-binding protein EsiB [Nitrosomonadaceae bacterium]